MKPNLPSLGGWDCLYSFFNQRQHKTLSNLRDKDPHFGKYRKTTFLSLDTVHSKDRDVSWFQDCICPRGLLTNRMLTVNEKLMLERDKTDGNLW